jgi:hypothetical protein
LNPFLNPPSSNNNRTASTPRNGQTKETLAVPDEHRRRSSPPIRLHYRLPAQLQEGCLLHAKKERTDFAVSSSSFTHWHCSDFSVQLHENNPLRSTTTHHRSAPHPRPTHGRFSTKLSSLTRQLLLPPLAQSLYSDSRPKA